MLSTTTLFPLLALALPAAAHFRLNQPTWRGDSFTAPASQWQYPCANINATTDSENRTSWPLDGGSVVFNGSHPWAMTYINLALGSVGASFNITLVEGFNQTGPGIFCFKKVGAAHFDEGLKKAGYSGVGDQRLDGLDASVQVIQLGERGSALYNCADIKFNATAELLSDDQCKNATGVSGVAVANVQGASSSPSPTTSAGATQSSGAAVRMGPAVGSGLFAAVVAWGLL
ncbi:hypothetical protein BDU57DRAFT_82462 [Ampelomyces quisqualis]|uniref:Copper acquisition factor BIM1-like domain-containing protein n=1 Tax=Ampelomyces quisqualis TaxID=50730 RepID=A0A6A5QA05_AMPQU|nr:hypothetical protein BDU57DRAFT_82462 [Ampelomyces quisqualis]